MGADTFAIGEMEERITILEERVRAGATLMSEMAAVVKASADMNVEKTLMLQEFYARIKALEETVERLTGEKRES